jgi:hypothetical protein
MTRCEISPPTWAAPKKEDVWQRVGKREEVVREFAKVINRHSLEYLSNTPDYILAEYLLACLERFSDAVESRKKHMCAGPEVKE